MTALCCPSCKEGLRDEGTRLVCAKCRTTFPVEESVPIFTPLALEGYPANDNVLADDGSSEVILTEFLDRPHYGRAIDVGCGTGRCLMEAIKVADELWCAEPCLTLLLQARSRAHQRARFVGATGDRLPFPDGYFDLALSITVVEHIADPRPMLMEIHRILRKPAGRLLVRNDAFGYGVVERLKSATTGRIPDPTHVNMLTPKGLRRLVESCGFRVLRSANFPFYRWTLEGRRVLAASESVLRPLATKAQLLCEPVQK